MTITFGFDGAADGGTLVQAERLPDGRTHFTVVVLDTVVSPKRIQMSRQHPWQIEPKAIIVSRPSEFSNPFVIVPVRKGGPFDVVGPDGFVGQSTGVEGARRIATDHFRAHAQRIGLYMLARRNLAGRDLACWCPLDHPCHADVLLELANPTDQRPEGMAA